MRREREELIRAFVKTPMDKIYFMAITSHYEGSRMHSSSRSLTSYSGNFVFFKMLDTEGKATFFRGNYRTFANLIQILVTRWRFSKVINI